MRPAATLTVVTILTATTVGSASPPAAAVTAIAGVIAEATRTPPELHSLIRQLGHTDYRTREMATARIARIGDRAIPALRAALQSRPEPETARRVDLLIRRLELERLTTARTVTLKGKNLTLKAAIAELSRQADYRIQFEDGRRPDRYTFDLHNVPFWQALDEVCNAGGLSHTIQGESNDLMVYYSDTYSPIVTYVGPFRVTPNQVYVSRSLQLTGLNRGHQFNRQPDQLMVYLQIMGEPKLPLAGVGSPTPLKAVDDTGASLIPSALPGHHQMSYYRSFQSYRSMSYTSHVQLTCANRKADAIRELQVRLPVVLLSETRPALTIPNVLEAKGKRVSGRDIDLKVSDVSEQNGVVYMKLGLTRRNGEAYDYDWMNGLTQRLELLDERGEKVKADFVDFTFTDQNSTTVSLQFTTPAKGKQAGEPVKLVLVDWVTVERDVEFTLRNIPLP